MSNGYIGKNLFVDLSKRELKDEALDERLCREFIGGYGMGARIIFSQQKAGVDPLGPDNILGFTTGPLTGTPAISAPRFMIVGKSPLTGSWGDSNSGGDFGPYLKFAGYDGVFVQGISDKPVYLFINNGQPEIKDASHLWGKDTVQTEDMLKADLGNDVRVSCIGPSGEKLSLISSVVTARGSVAGRSGFGAVMGSKKLKAVCVKGNTIIPQADGSKAAQMRKKYLKGFDPRSLEAIDYFKKYGTSSGNVELIKTGDAGVKNWGGVGVVDFPDAESLGADKVLARQRKPAACWHCPIACKGVMKAGDQFPYGEGSRKPEYETFMAFGPLCLNSNLESIIMANDICNRYGIDTISAGSTIAFAIECFENGLITEADTDGIELTWSNYESIIAMTRKLARREGFGDVLADGTRVAAKKIGKGSEAYAININGRELPMHDPKFGFQFTVDYIVGATPATHTRGIETRTEPEILKGKTAPVGLPCPEVDYQSFSGRGDAHRIANNLEHVASCAGLCHFSYIMLPFNSLIDFMDAVTGWDITTDELIKTGERITNMMHAFNIREGLNPLKYKLNDRIFGKTPLKEGPTAGITVDVDTMLKDYLIAMDWDLETTKPSKKKLQELGLHDVVEELQ